MHENHKMLASQIQKFIEKTLYHDEWDLSQESYGLISKNQLVYYTISIKSMTILIDEEKLFDEPNTFLWKNIKNIYKNSLLTAYLRVKKLVSDFIHILKYDISIKNLVISKGFSLSLFPRQIILQIKENLFIFFY